MTNTQADSIIRKGGSGADRTQFGTHDRPDAALNLPLRTTPVTLNVETNIPVNESPLPPLPTGLDQPRISFDYGDEDGRLYVYSHWTTGEPYEVGVTVWKDGFGDWENSIVSGLEETGLEEDTDDQIIEYLQAVYSRVDSRLAHLNALVAEQAQGTVLTSIFGSEA